MPKTAEKPVTSEKVAKEPFRFTCDRKSLVAALKTVAPAVSNRTSLPILQHVLIQPADGGRLRIAACDTELYISTSIPAQVLTCIEDGGLTVPQKLLADVLSSMTGDDVTVEVNAAKGAKVKCNRSEYKLLGLPHDEFPKFPSVPNDDTFTISNAVLRESIQQTIFACSKDEARAHITGIFVRMLDTTAVLVATDTHRVACRVAPVTDSLGRRESIVPERAMKTVLALLDEEGEVRVRLGETYAEFTVPGGEGDTIVTTALINGVYPNYERVIPNDHTRKMVVRREDFTKVVRRALFVAKDNANKVVLVAENGLLKVTAETTLTGTAYEELDCTLEGDPITICFNAKYLLDMCGAIGNEMVAFLMTESLKPARIVPVVGTGERDDYSCTIMPMQLPV